MKLIIQPTTGYEIENDSIGAYEFWGQKCHDIQPDYVSGWVQFPTDAKTEKQAQNYFKKPKRLRELLSFAKDVKVFGDGIAWSDEFDTIIEKGTVCVFVNYTAGMPDDEDEIRERKEEERREQRDFLKMQAAQ